MCFCEGISFSIAVQVSKVRLNEQSDGRDDDYGFMITAQKSDTESELYFTLDPSGAIISTTDFGVEALFGYSAAQMRGVSLSHLGSSSDHSFLSSFLFHLIFPAPVRSSRSLHRPTPHFLRSLLP
jgi:hypothetical protein